MLISKQYKKVYFAIFTAMKEELSYFESFFANCKVETVQVGDFKFKVYDYEGYNILISSTGLGTSFTAAAVTLIHCHFNPDYILFSGTAGGISPGLKLCDVIIAEQAFEAEIQGAFTILKNTPFESCLTHPHNNKNLLRSYSADANLLKLVSELDFSELNVHSGIVVSSNAFPAPKELFENIKTENPHSIDMETSAFYQTAWLLNIPALAVRGISNLLNQDGTDENVHQSDVKGSAEAAAKVVLKIVDKLILKNNAILDLQSTYTDDVSTLINSFNLEAHPEGGYFRQIYKSDDKVKSINATQYDDETRGAGSSIYYLLDGNNFSAWHSLKSDEIWHYYKGSTVTIHVIDKNGRLSSQLLGDPTKTIGAEYQVIIKAGDWFAAENCDKSSYCFVGCTVSPGFEYADFKLADRQELSEKFPQHAVVIERLIRVHSNEINSLNRNSYSPSP